MIKINRIIIALFISLFMVSFVTTASAGVITVTNDPTGTARATFGGDDIMDWTTLGPDQSNPSNPFNATSNGGLGLTVSQTDQNPFERRTRGTSWGGNFTDGNDLLWTGGSNGLVSISFSSEISGIGFQINPNFSDVLTDVELFDSANVSLGIFNLTTNDRGQNSASFIGFTSDMMDISRITISQPLREDFAINQLSLITNGIQNVPEPAPLALLGLGLLGLGMARKRRR